MNLQNLSNSFRRGVKQNSPLILSVAAAVGTLATAYLTGRASFKAAEVIRKAEEESPLWTQAMDPKTRFMERTKLVWKLYIPPAISGVTTIVCVIGSNRIGTQKLIAANTAFTVVEQGFAEYRDKVREVHGVNKEQAIRDQIVADRVLATAPGEGVILVGDGHVLCLELYTGRYFNSDMETLRKAQNDINAKIFSHPYATMNDFYYEIGIDLTTPGSNLGWQDGKLMELLFSTALTPDGKPCITFDYNYVAPL